jgi:hypothetical protein
MASSNNVGLTSDNAPVNYVPIIGPTTAYSNFWFLFFNSSASAWLPRQTTGIPALKNVSLIQTGGVPNTLAAIQIGAVNAGIVSPPTTLRAQKLGFKEIINITSLKLPFIQAGAVITENYARSNRKTVKKVLKALIEATSAIKTDKPFAEAEAIIGKYTRLTDDDLLEETYNALSDEFPRIHYTSAEALHVMVGIISDQQKKEIQGPVERFAVNGILKDIEEEGFVNRLYSVGGMR